jgi:magnesium-transporting ATPase (P-type)
MQIILHQLLNPLIFILVAAAAASLAIGEGKDAIFIFLVIFINSALGTYQEYNAERSADSLQKLMKIKARVRRDGNEKEAPSEELVPGDIVLLESGMKVPADMRLLEVSGLEIDESFLTGESIAAKKQIERIAGKSWCCRKNEYGFCRRYRFERKRHGRGSLHRYRYAGW